MTDPMRKAITARRVRGLEYLWKVLHLTKPEDLLDAPVPTSQLFSENELKAMAFTLLRALPHEEAMDVWGAVFPDWPVSEPPAFLTAYTAHQITRGMSERDVAAMAMACTNCLPPSRRRKFAQWLNKKAREE